MRKSIRILAAAAMFGVAASAGAVTLINGSFELGTDPGAGFSTEAAGSTAITGWTVGGFGVDYIGGYWMASEGVRSIDLSALNAGSVSQSLDTIIGNDYTVTFDLSGNPDAGVGNKLSVISVSGSVPNVVTYTVGAGNSREDMNWETFAYTFTAFSTKSQLTFASAEFNPFGPALDNVSVLDNGGGIGATVPEPTTWAMLVIGFGFIGLSVRNRRGRSVAA